MWRCLLLCWLDPVQQQHVPPYPPRSTHFRSIGSTRGLTRSSASDFRARSQCAVRPRRFFRRFLVLQSPLLLSQSPLVLDLHHPPARASMSEGTASQKGVHRTKGQTQSHPIIVLWETAFTTRLRRCYIPEYSHKQTQDIRINGVRGCLLTVQLINESCREASPAICIMFHQHMGLNIALLNSRSLTWVGPGTSSVCVLLPNTAARLASAPDFDFAASTEQNRKLM